MKNIIASLLLTLSLAGPASVLAQETETQVQSAELEATDVQEAKVPVSEDQVAPATPPEAAPEPDQEAVLPNGELKKKSSQDLVNEIEDLTQRFAVGEVAKVEREALKIRIRALRDRIERAESGTGAPWEIASHGGGAVLLGSLAIVLIFGTPIMLVAAVLYASYRKRRLMHNTIDQYVSSGRDIPPEVLQSLHKHVTPGNNLHRGFVMIGVGLGVIACFTVVRVTEAAALGLIPLFIGLAQILIWKLEKKPVQ